MSPKADDVLQLFVSYHSNLWNLLFRLLDLINYSCGVLLAPPYLEGFVPITWRIGGSTIIHCAIVSVCCVQRYAPLAYGPSGEHMTKLGRAWVYDVDAFQCSDWLKDDDVSNHGSWSSAYDHMITPSGSTSSHDMVTPPATHFSSSENSSRLVNVVNNLWCCYNVG